MQMLDWNDLGDLPRWTNEQELGLFNEVMT